ncbi:hypothetical protein [Sulfitobacter guttiformis]|uniref:hypothetical protein n=1 Tax=Sulfitobacter guttiformis TaxID=74349 RepID=UPI0011C493DD|nr:hypothetical protein [Sulfitobacter guttiformis]
MCTYILIPFLALAACSSAPASYSSRMEGAPLNFAAQPAEIDAQAAALIELSERMVVQSTIKGAAMGAVVGCGLAVASAGNVSNCLAAATVAGVGGALAGHMAGKRQVTHRIETVSPSVIVRTLRKTNQQLALVQGSLPARLAAQDRSLATLDLKLATGSIDRETYLERKESIVSERRAIADALLATEANAVQTTANLQSAAARGQTGLAWHISAIKALEREVGSARSSISLL